MYYFLYHFTCKTLVAEKMNITEPEQAFNSSESVNKTGRFWVQEQTDNVQAAIDESQG